MTKFIFSFSLFWWTWRSKVTREIWWLNRNNYVIILNFISFHVLKYKICGQSCYPNKNIGWLVVFQYEIQSDWRIMFLKSSQHSSDCIAINYKAPEVKWGMHRHVNIKSRTTTHASDKVSITLTTQMARITHQ